MIEEPNSTNSKTNWTPVVWLITLSAVALLSAYFATDLWKIRAGAELSTYAHDIDWLCDLITLTVGFWFFLAMFTLFYFIYAFRRKPGVKAMYLSGENKWQKRWISNPHYLIIACDVFLIAGTLRVWHHVKQEQPDADETVRVIAQQWAWTFQHPGLDGQLNTEDDITVVDELHLTKGKVYHFQLESMDVLHSFSIPVFRIKQDAVPGRVITGWFKIKDDAPNGEYDIQCAEMCGLGHGLMRAALKIESEEEHTAWLDSVMHPKAPEAPAAPAGQPAAPAAGGAFE